MAILAIWWFRGSRRLNIVGGFGTVSNLPDSSANVENLISCAKRGGEYHYVINRNFLLACR